MMHVKQNMLNMYRKIIWKVLIIENAKQMNLQNIKNWNKTICLTYNKQYLLLRRLKKNAVMRIHLLQENVFAILMSLTKVFSMSSLPCNLFILESAGSKGD